MTKVEFRFEGGYPWFDSTAIKIPRDVTKGVEEYLDETEVQTRMSQVLYNFKLFDLHTLDWNAKLEDIGIDEYEQTAALTSSEHEVHTVFTDRVFENFTSLNDVKAFIAKDHNCF